MPDLLFVYGSLRSEFNRLTDPEKTLTHLDDYEGEEYPRIAARLLTPDAEAWAYHYAGHQHFTERIASGDFTKP